MVGDLAGFDYILAIERAHDHAQLRASLVNAYRHIHPMLLVGRITEALILAELAAMYSLTIDYPARQSVRHLNARGWRVPSLFRQAAAWLSDKIAKAVTVPVEYEFGRRPEERAPRVAKAAQLDTAAKLVRKVEADAAAAVPLDETKAELRQLLRELGCEPKPIASHPIITEEVQSRFARTRETILDLDFYRAAYPYWRYTATLDERTTLGCRALHGLTMPAGDPKWVGFIPPRHWRCRAHVEAVVHSEGVRAKKTSPAGEYAGDGTFGTLNDEWEPKPGSYPEDLWAIYKEAKGIQSPHIEMDGAWWRKERPAK